MTARRLRLVVYSQSIISDIGNPRATTVRAMCQAFVDAGHDVTHLEERANPFLQEMLRLRGYAPMRVFNERYPLVRYRQYTVTGGWERVIWFGREIGTADAVVTYPGVSDAVINEISALSSPRIVPFWTDASGEERDLLPLWFEPAVLSRPGEAPRDEELVVAYDSTLTVADGLIPRMSLGRLTAQGWTTTSEIQAEARYMRARTVFMSEDLASGSSLARVLLPVANGATVRLVDRNSAVTRDITKVPDANNAQVRATRLAEAIDQMLAARQTS